MPDDALELLKALGLPRKQWNARSALTLLALADLRPDGRWTDAKNPLLRTVDVMAFIRDVYDKDYAANSRETFRKETLRPFEHARIVDRNPDDPARPTNSGKTAYRLTDEVVAVLKTRGTVEFADALASFTSRFGTLQAAYAKVRETHRIPLKLPDGSTVLLSPGKHNLLQVAVIERFGPRFAPGATVLYIGDTAKKHVVRQTEDLSKLGIPITEHEKLPDVVLFDPVKNWLFLIEAVTSHGPVSPTRHRDLESFLGACEAERIYVTAFTSSVDFRKYAADIAWETEVWIDATPDHMIHFDGLKFLGPYKTPPEA